ncbi:CarboxypepD_reg-like domain-containing protein [Flavobacterium fryxellicola]|uniref:TonB-dependent receptor n=1 Tax=Flavobacterium fryxellicola TaxID=249352 RepID=A0A167VA87_9FLAO|nr:carboxypeptidase-like regulatory domain-containing protein [Flavobacterium fryxellicola]OAB26217.1 hypothetical protein FBFR_13345 [Flavobacterium fryxellicola]SHN79605.1 CarboxypepD_reg-like domain-containing protein [Flavobacterium fryxellicola]
MIKYFSIIAAALISLNSFAQTGTIKGTIKTSDGSPAELVTVALKGTTKGTTANSKGAYELRKVSPGNYTIIALLVGLETREINVEVKANETTIAPVIILNQNSQQLKEVVVSSNGIKFTTKKSDYVARMPLENIENPQVYNVITSDLLEIQGTVDYKTALTNAAGV